MKELAWLIRVRQFAFSVLFPLCFFCFLGGWLENKFDLGGWVCVFCGGVGMLVAFNAVRRYVRGLGTREDRRDATSDLATAFNDHE